MQTNGTEFNSQDSRAEEGALPNAIPARLMELWMAAVLGVFFVIRILGSQTWQHVVNTIRHHRPA